MTTDKTKIQAARQRVESGAFEDAMNAGREIISRLRIPHTKTLKQSGGLQFTWNWLQTKLNSKYIGFILKKLGYEPSNPNEPSSVRDEFTNGVYNVLVAPQYGVIVVRPVGREPLRASAEDGSPPEDQEFDEYDDYDQWLADAKKHWPAARHNKRGLPGWVHGYGEANDEEFLTGPDLQSDVVGVWNTDDGFGWILRSN